MLLLIYVGVFTEMLSIYQYMTSDKMKFTCLVKVRKWIWSQVWRNSQDVLKDFFICICVCVCVCVCMCVCVVLCDMVIDGYRLMLSY